MSKMYSVSVETPGIKSKLVLGLGLIEVKNLFTITLNLRGPVTTLFQPKMVGWVFSEENSTWFSNITPVFTKTIN